VVVIVASAGGLPALTRVLRDLPLALGAAVVALIHLAPDHQSIIAALLSHASGVPVHEARGGERLAAGLRFVAPPAHHLSIEPGGTLRLSQEAPVHFSRPSADVLLESAARCGPAVIGVILTGAGHDGAAGALAVRRAGGYVLVQDPATAAFPSMPESAIAAGAASDVLPIEQIGAAITGLIQKLTADAQHR